VTTGPPQGILELKVGEAEVVELRLDHLSGAEVATLLDVWCPPSKSVGTLKTVTLLLADGVQARAVEELVRLVDRPELVTDRAGAGTGPEDLFFEALRRYLDQDGAPRPEYGESLAALRRSQTRGTLGPLEGACAHLLAARMLAAGNAAPEHQRSALEAAEAAARDADRPWLSLTARWRLCLLHRHTGERRWERERLRELLRDFQEFDRWRIVRDARRRLDELEGEPRATDPEAFDPGG